MAQKMSWSTMAKVMCAVLAAIVLVKSPSGDELFELDLASISADVPVFDSQQLASEVSSLLKINTISAREEPYHLSPLSQKNMKKAHNVIRTFYPTLFSKVSIETIDEFSLLLKLPGTDPSLRPALVMCHLDVVPVEEGTEGDWGKAHGCASCGPFSGALHGGYVWGRGALDMKSTCVTFLHAAEKLLTRPQGFSPERSIYLAIGHDEETMGDGHRKIAQALEQAGVQLEAVLDEGNPTMQRGSSPLNAGFDLALPALAEKGYLSLHLAVNLSAHEAGHAAFPPASGTAITILAAALQRIHAGQPAPTLRRPTEDLLKAVAHALPAPAGFILDRTVPPAARRHCC